MTISFLKAGNGDCIYIKDGGHHVLVDSGEHCEELTEVVNDIRQAEESIDLLVVTHYDADHIRAICELLKLLTPKERKQLVKKVWFNATKVGFTGNKKNLSATDATEFGTLLLEADIPWVSELKKGTVEIISENISLEVLDGGTIYTRTKTGLPLSNFKCDWNTSFKSLEPYLNDDSLDNSPTNSQSMILVAHVKGHDILLPGDAVPSKLLAALENYQKGKPCPFALVKMPHHGSYKNITKGILEKIVCFDYVVTTDGSGFHHPNKKMLLKVAKWGQRQEGKQITIHLNYYDTLMPKLGISAKEVSQYNVQYDGKRTFEF